MSDFVIESAIPLPEARSVSGKWAILHKMEVGDSFFLPIMERTRCSAMAQNRKLFPDKRFTIRQVDGGLRCWRAA